MKTAVNVPEPVAVKGLTQKFLGQCPNCGSYVEAEWDTNNNAFIDWENDDMWNVWCRVCKHKLGMIVWTLDPITEERKE